MRCVTRSARWLWAVALVICLFSPSPAAATLFKSDWYFRFEGIPEPATTPFWDCPDIAGGGLICSYLWEQGLEVSSNTDLPMYGDAGPFYDSYGVDLPLKRDLPDSGLLQIVAACRDGESPCFRTFTPLSLHISSYADEPSVGMFVTSSRGGFRTTSNGAVNLSGAKWTDISSMEIGLYLPNRCGSSEDACEHGEQALYLDSLVYADRLDPVPEPTSLALLAAALFVRRLRARPSRI